MQILFEILLFFYFFQDLWSNPVFFRIPGFVATYLLINKMCVIDIKLKHFKMNSKTQKVYLNKIFKQKTSKI